MFDIDETLKVEILTEYINYEEIDLEEEEPDGEYSGVTIKINDCVFLSFGDYYHDKGCSKADAVEETLKALFGNKKVKVSRKNVWIKE